MAQSTTDRLALIRKAAQKFQKTQTKQAYFVRQERPVSAISTKPVKPAKTFLDNSDSMKDERYYTDSSKYAAEYYGEVYRETTKYDYDESQPHFGQSWE